MISGPVGKATLLYSSGWPEMTWPDGTKTVLNNPVGEPTIKTDKLYTHFVVKFDQEIRVCIFHLVKFISFLCVMKNLQNLFNF